MKKHEHHDHCRCEENLGLCKRCDVVFCVKCSKEWGAECTRSHPPYWYTTTDITLTGTTGIPNTTYTTCAHAN